MEVNCYSQTTYMWLKQKALDIALHSLYVYIANCLNVCVDHCYDEDYFQHSGLHTAGMGDQDSHGCECTCAEHCKLLASQCILLNDNTQNASLLPEGECSTHWFCW